MAHEAWTRTAFERRHAVLEQLLEDMAPLARSYARVRGLLAEWRLLLEDHWSRQPEGLWQELEKRGDTGAAEFLRVDLRDMKIRHLTFFEQYVDAPSPTAARHFPADFAQFRSAVTARIRIEQEYLLPRL